MKLLVEREVKAVHILRKCEEELTMTKRLDLIFMGAAGKMVRISLPNVSEELQGEDVQSVTRQIIMVSIFAPGGYDLTQAMGARIVTTDVHEYDFI